jgi:hypothetical protein
LAILGNILTENSLSSFWQNLETQKTPLGATLVLMINSAQGGPLQRCIGELLGVLPDTSPFLLNVFKEICF